MDGMVESAGESTEHYNPVLHLTSSLAESSAVGMSGAYPVRLGLKVGEAGDAFH